MNRIALAALLCATSGLVQAQFDFNLEGRPVQIHSFATQGFVVSDNNNFLTMDTRHGSFGMTDFGVNISTQLTDKLRVGLQVYDRSIGQLGGWRPLVDYAYVDYRFKDWFGIRAGRVKTQLGLYTSTQDADFLRTWAMLPQSIYPTDLRSANISHDGIDFYGDIALKGAGSVRYTAYAGHRPEDTRSGQYFQYEDANISSNKMSASMAGADLRWTTPIPGFTAGVSECFQSERGHAIGQPPGTTGSASRQPIDAVTGPYRQFDAYGEYLRGPLSLASEYRTNTRMIDIRTVDVGFRRDLSEVAWFVSAAYKLTPWLEVGGYHSHYLMGANYYDPLRPANLARPHIYDEVLTARFDLTHYWNVKIEGHFMDGTGDTMSPHGFYLRDNTLLGKPSTHLLVIRTGWIF